MAYAQQQYPDHLNPFGSDEEEETSDARDGQSANTKLRDDYPDYLSPFGEADEDVVQEDTNAKIDDYDDSLNPFGDVDEDNNLEQKMDRNQTSQNNNQIDTEGDAGNPFSEGNEPTLQHLTKTPAQDTAPSSLVSSCNFEPDPMEPPPKPLPRTKKRAYRT